MHVWCLRSRDGCVPIQRSYLSLGYGVNDGVKHWHMLHIVVSDALPYQAGKVFCLKLKVFFFVQASYI